MSPVLRWLPEAVLDLARLREFILIHNPNATERVAKRILESLGQLQAHPMIGRPVMDIDQPKLRDFVIPFGRAGCTVRYAVIDEDIIIVRIWHSRENRIAF